VRVYLPACGWVEFDPTNGIVGNADLVRVAIARDPRQALPLSGGWRARLATIWDMDVEVEVLRDDRAGSPAARNGAQPIPSQRTLPWPDRRGTSDAHPGGLRDHLRLPGPTPMLLMLNVRPEREVDLETPDLHATSTRVADRKFSTASATSAAGAAAGRQVTFSAEFVIRDSGKPRPGAGRRPGLPVEDLPNEALVFLLGSRYCETDRISDLAWSLFGDLPRGWSRVQAIVDYAHQRIEFGYSTPADQDRLGRPRRGRGVCRDFAHLAITLCRCMNIPARYCTGYLGDIGVPQVDAPMDFSAWFEAYLGGGWRTFDASHNKPRIGRILMAIGRDATDAAITTSFGPARLQSFIVRTDQLLSPA
jgi:transglutaminase-like putative cysteine protease